MPVEDVAGGSSDATVELAEASVGQCKLRKEVQKLRMVRHRLQLKVKLQETRQPPAIKKATAQVINLITRLVYFVVMNV